jgi:hypothetical protein
MKMMYRLVFRDGSHSAWSFDKERTEQNAKSLRATVETKEYRPITY